MDKLIEILYVMTEEAGVLERYRAMRREALQEWIFLCVKLNKVLPDDEQELLAQLEGKGGKLRSIEKQEKFYRGFELGLTIFLQLSVSHDELQKGVSEAEALKHMMDAVVASLYDKSCLDLDEGMDDVEFDDDSE